MHVLHAYAVACLHVYRRKVPDGAYAHADDRVRNGLRSLLGRRNDAQVHRVLLGVYVERVDVPYLLVADRVPDQLGVNVEYGHDVEAFLLKPHVVGERLTHVARADQYHLIFSVQADDVHYLFFEHLDMIAVALLAKTAKAVQVLPDLRRLYAHLLAQLLRGYAFHAYPLKVLKITVILWAACG